MRSNARFWLLLVAALVIVVLIVGGSGGDGPPLDPRSVRPDGAKGVVETLERLGASVDLDRAVPEPSATTALLLQDRLSSEDEVTLRRWVRAGGVLVVADPSSTFAGDAIGNVSPFEADAGLRQGVCTIEPLQDARVLTVPGRFIEIGSNSASCFGDRSRAFVVAEPFGDGTVVTVGGPAVFTNAELGQDDAAVLAVALLAPQRGASRVAFLGPSTVEFGEEGLGDLVPPRVTNAIVQLLAAFLIYALHRSRRLGDVVPEPVPVRIEGSELVLKSGLLSERARDPASAAQIMRDDLMHRARRALSVPLVGDDQTLAERIANQTGFGSDHVVATLLTPVESEADLIRIAQNLTEIENRLFDDAVRKLTV